MLGEVCGGWDGSNGDGEEETLVADTTVDGSHLSPRLHRLR